MEEIAFIDLEASGLSARSWPIEVGWCFVAGPPKAVLITPAEDWSLDHWDAAAERLHGVAYDALFAHGEDPKKVCDMLNEQLAGKSVYSDAPDWDGFWLYRLFQAARVRQRFVLQDLYTLFAQVPSDRLDGLIAKADIAAPRAHRAMPDALNMRALYALAKADMCA